VLHSGSFLALSALIAFFAEGALEHHTASGTQAKVQMRLLETYDLIGAAKAQPSIAFDVLHQDSPVLERAIRSDGVKLYSPRTSDALHASPALLTAIAETKPTIVSQQWRALIRQHPWLYLTVRAKVFAWIFLTPETTQCVPFIVGVQGPPDAMHALGLPVRMDARDRGLQSYTNAFLHTPVFSHFFFALLALALVATFLVRCRPDDIAIACLLAASLAFAFSFFVISIACDYRYLYFLDLAALAGLFYFSLDPVLRDKAASSAVKP
jgi:hypothetical protein